LHYEPLTVLNNTALAPGHHLLKLQAVQPLPEVRAGQFLSLRCDPGDMHSLLRPLSILDVDFTAGTLSIYYKELGRLSARLANIPAGAVLDCLYPLGVGFPWTNDLRRIALVGGGVGLAPLLCWARQLEPYGATMHVVGFFGGASAVDLVPELLKDYDFPMHFATIDGSVGRQGNVVELFCEHPGEFDVVYACGPNRMLAALKQAVPSGIPAFASLEEYMACGVGACLGCVAPIIENGVLRHLSVCKDGPVFDLRSVLFTS
jgi:dihydroorotate dehydrogenase electron transfer subunit